MLSKTRTGAVYGVDASPVEVEVNIAHGGNGEFRIVGLPDTAIRESRARIDTAIRSSGFSVPFRQITVNLAPAGVRKEGSSFDLPMAVAILRSTEAIKTDLSKFLMVGELSLDGRLRPIRGALALALLARSMGLPHLILPRENAREAALASGVSVYPMHTLSEVVEFVTGMREVQPLAPGPDTELTDVPTHSEDFEDVRGQQHAKRAIEVAVAGGHNILMIGPPGSGKTMLARRIPSIMPPMALEECLDTTKIHSAAGLLGAETGMVRTRPFRAPHHTISNAGLVGGGSVPRPGEISLAHNGVLFLDELPEFPRHVLEALRQPLEEGQVTVTRSRISLTFPAALTLVAAMNPCKCGFQTDPYRECVCTPRQIHGYRSRISGPLMDRIDIQVDVGAVSYQEISRAQRAESSTSIRKRVGQARQAQSRRFAGSRISTNSGMTPRRLRAYCSLTPQCERLLETAITSLGMSARGWNRILKVSRTIADLDGVESIQPSHIAEAIRYRKLDDLAEPKTTGR